MILVIWASPNKNGLTATAMDMFMKGLGYAKSTAEVVNIHHYKIERCRICGNGWGLCKSKGTCVISDDFDTLYEKMIHADSLVFITPVYWHDLPESLKTFLDRLRRCETKYNHKLKNKISLLIACAGGSGRGAIQCLNTLEQTLGHMEIKVIDRLPITQFNKGFMLPALVGAGEAFANTSASE